MDKKLDINVLNEITLQTNSDFSTMLISIFKCFKDTIDNEIRNQLSAIDSAASNMFGELFLNFIYSVLN
jgi:hypothetical protein